LERIQICKFSESKGDTVAFFLIGKGVEALTIENENFDINRKLMTSWKRWGNLSLWHMLEFEKQ